jgi:hypothetical protein|tara:strand:- start:199 stop:3063 length:2865 start_codon:yes stop_codon:yes gene_type:complete
MMKTMLIPVAVFALSAAASAADIKSLPEYDEGEVRVREDWLVVPAKRKSAVYQAAGGKDIVLSNGIIARRFRLSPNAATVSLKNLQTGEEFVRSVRPEATVTVNGKAWNVGGLNRQRLHNYIRYEWLDELKGDVESFEFVDFTVGPTVAPFPWKKRPEWLSIDLPWPAPGKRLTMIYEQSSEVERVAKDNFEKARVILARDDIDGTALEPEWKHVTSPYVREERPSERSSYENEGKAGEVMTLGNCIAYGERELPKEFSAIECRVDPGIDESGDWGPGMVAVWPEKTIKLQLRPDQNRIAYVQKGYVRKVGKFSEGSPQHLRMVFEGDVIEFWSSADNENWKRLSSVKNEDGLPQSVRLGKTGPDGAEEELATDPGEVVRCRVDRFRVYGGPVELSDEELKRLEGKLKPAKPLRLEMIYEIYDGTPILCKSFKIYNTTSDEVRIDSFKAEILATVEAESSVSTNPDWMTPNLFVFADMNFGGMDQKGANPCVEWVRDPSYTTQVNYRTQTPCLVKVAPPIGPAVDLEPGESFESFRVFEMLNDSWDRQRIGLSKCRFFRTVAPWTQENPIMMHVRGAKEEAVKLAIDQCAEVGFEMVILTFGSGFNAEDNRPATLEFLKSLVDYAHAKGVALGGYSHLSGRNAKPGEDNITGVKPKFGRAPCIGSEWGHQYFKKLEHLFDPEGVGMDILEHDGSYPGDACRSGLHPYHGSYPNSQWAQWIRIRDFYRRCRGKGVYLNVPDYYYLNGSSKCAMGYREVNWSLPRREQELIERQNIYDGTWDKTPSMGWMFVPLVQYHGGGAAATIEPLKDHIPHYEQRMANLFGAGVQATYRGPRLYDTDETKAAVKKWTSWYKKHRAILESDIIHLRRPDGRDIDYLLHVNPGLEEKALLAVYNPLETAVRKTIEVPLYYAGLSDTARVSCNEGADEEMELRRDYTIELEVGIEPNGVNWYVFR